MTVHLRRAGTSLVLDLPTDRFPVVRHWGTDLGPFDGAAFTDLATAQATSTGDNSSWITNDLPVLPLPHLGWAGRPALLLHRQDGSAFSAHVTGIAHAVAAEAGADVVRSVGADPVHAIGVATELRLEACGLVRVRVTVTNRATDGRGPQGSPLVVGEVTPVLPVPADASELLDMAGHHGRERRLVRTPFTAGTRLRESWEGRPGHDAATWLAAGRTGFGWRSGTVHGVHPAWSGNTRSVALNTSQGLRLLGAGELLHPGEVVLDPGESYTCQIGRAHV